jgi:GH3 auxin-responsive promoter
VLARIVLAIARRLDDETLRGLVDRVFVRTKRAIEQSSTDPRGAQVTRLRAILGENRDTEVGKRFGFAEIQDFDDYRARVPIVSWDAVAPLVDRMLAGERGVLVAEDPYFYATTSGTTGRRKLVPVTASFVNECRETNRLLYRQTLKEIPQLLKGKRLSMRSPKTQDVGQGKQAGSITVALGGFEDEEGVLDAVPADVFVEDDFHKRYFLALRFALQERITVCAAVNPSTLALYAKTLAEHADALAVALETGALGADVDEPRGARLRARARKDVEAAARVRASAKDHGAARMRDVFPHLAGLVCWKGGSAPWYLKKLEASYGTLPILDYGYVATEGCFGAPVSAQSADSVLVPHAHVIELAPLEFLEDVRAGRASTVLLHEAEVGREYVPIVTTGAGLYRYDMNDVVRVTGKLCDPKRGAPLVVFQHKAGAMASITGEKVGEAHVVAAAARARIAADGFVCAPALPPGDSVPFWLLALDSGAAEVSDAQLQDVAARMDAALREENLEYEAKRSSLRLEHMRAARLPAHAIARMRERRVKAGAPDAHVKIPHVSADGRLLLELGLEQSAPALAVLMPCRVAPEGAS